MKIRIVDTPLNGNATINDAKADAILDLFLLSEGHDTFETPEARLDMVAGLLKAYVIDKAKRHLRLQRKAAEEASFAAETQDLD